MQPCLLLAANVSVPTSGFVLTAVSFCPTKLFLLISGSTTMNPEMNGAEFVDQVQAEHADDEIPPSAQEFEHFSLETEPSLC